MIRRPLRVIPILLATAWTAASLGDEPLPQDPRIETGKFANGVTWMYMQHPVPPGKMALMLHVRSGSLSESDDQRGLAHFLEHMAFNGSEHFPPGQLVPYFESIGMEFGRDLNAFTGFDQTVYVLFLPDATPEQVDKGLTVLSDYAYHLTLPEAEIDKERGVVLEEQRAGMSAMQRVRDALFAKLFVGSRLGERIPIGLSKVIESVKRPELEQFYRTWYRPELMTVLMAGDAPSAPYVPLIEKWFGQYKSTAAAQPALGPELKPFTQAGALVLSDPEWVRGDVDVYNVLPKRPPITTVEQARVKLIEDIGSWIMGRRVLERIRKGEAAYREASAQVANFFSDGMLVNASAVGEPKDREKMLDQLVAELTRARQYGFLPRELELCQKEMLASAEEAVRREPTREARDLLSELAQAVNDREPLLSAQQYLDLLKREFPTIVLAEVNEAFARNFKPGTFAYVVTLPKKEDVKLPTEDELLAAARAAEARQVEPPAPQTGPTSLLEKEPAPGKLLETDTDADLGIVNGWLDNGVRVHHRFMDYKKDTVMVGVTLAGGAIEEAAENAGVTAVATLVVNQPATQRLSSTDIQDIMTGKNVNVECSAQDDTFTVTVTGSPKDLESGLQLVYALLTAGTLEPSALDNWKKQALEQYEAASKLPQYVAFDTFLRTISGNDPRRIVLLKPEQIQAQTLERAQAWYDRLCREAPIEVAVVGEIKLEDVQPLLEKYVGALAKRPRSAAYLDKLRVLRRPVGPLVARAEVETITPQAMVLAGFMGCDAADIGNVRTLNTAANILDSRLVKRVREELSLVYAIQAVNGPGRAYRDSGVFFSGAPCAPDKVDEVQKEVETILQAFADTGPTAEELDNAKKQIRNHLDTQLKEPSYWFGQLQALDLHKLKLADLKNIPEAYEALTAEQVQGSFKQFDLPARTFRISAVPKAPAETQPAGEGAKSEPAPKP
jgi:zinc protease